MKATVKTGILILLVCVMFGCRKERHGDIAIKMTDAPGDYLQVNVDVSQIQIHYDGGNNNVGWIDLNTQSGIYDLLTLQNGITTMLATKPQVPAAKVSQIRLILGPNNTVMLNDSTVHALKVPSAYQSGIKLNVHADVPENSMLTVTLDFDADQSVNMEGNGDYIMKPVINVLSIQ
jgi:hypothetical protein